LTSTAQKLTDPPQDGCPEKDVDKAPQAGKGESISGPDKSNTCRDLVITRRMNNPPAAAAAANDQDKLVVRRRYQHYRPNPCGDWCGCRCHKASKAQTPQWFASVMGNLLVSYKGIRLWPRACNDK
jgi:hypothetical protein